jgi:hypothetical protein
LPLDLARCFSLRYVPPVAGRGYVVKVQNSSPIINDQQSTLDTSIHWYRTISSKTRTLRER